MANEVHTKGFKTGDVYIHTKACKVYLHIN